MVAASLAILLLEVVSDMLASMVVTGGDCMATSSLAVLLLEVDSDMSVFPAVVGKIDGFL